MAVNTVRIDGESVELFAKGDVIVCTIFIRDFTAVDEIIERVEE